MKDLCQLYSVKALIYSEMLEDLKNLPVSLERDALMEKCSRLYEHCWKEIRSAHPVAAA